MNIAIRSIEGRSLNIEWMQGFETEVSRRDDITQYHYWVKSKDWEKKGSQRKKVIFTTRGRLYGATND